MIDQRSRGEQVAAHIRRLIFDGELHQGDRVRQDDIAKELGVSRIPVREAIVALDREGWVTMEPHRGAFVQGLDEATVRDHYDLLGVIYGLAARRATDRAADAEVATFVAAQRALVGCRDDVEAFATRNEALLRDLVQMAGSRRIAAVRRVLPSIVAGNFFARVPGSVDAQCKGTAAIARAIKAREGDRAEAACADLLRRQGANAVRALTERGVIAVR